MLMGKARRSPPTDEHRRTKTELHTDELDRVVRRVITDATGTTVTDESFGYDASGRLAVHRRQQENLGTVEETYSYDAMGRQIESTMDNAEVNGAPGKIVRTKTTYDLPGRQIVAFDPYVTTETIKTTSTLDGLGRTIKTERQAVSGGDTVVRVNGYDKHGFVAYETDTVRLATLHQFDVLGRELKTIHSDGTSADVSWNGWGEILESIGHDASNAVTAHSKNYYTYKGRLFLTNELESASAAAARQTYYRLDEGEKSTSVRLGEAASLTAPSNDTASYRVAQASHDLAGRPLAQVVGEATGSSSTVTDVFNRTKVPTYSGALPVQVDSEEPKTGGATAASYQTKPGYDGLYRPSSTTAPGGFTTDTHYDEAGNLLKLTRPGMKVEETHFDSRGLPFERILPDTKQQHTQYDERGVLHQYADEEGERTRYTTDSLGRIHIIEYVGDGTTEQIEYENVTGLVSARKDRAGKWLSFLYDAGGRVTEIHAGQDPTTTPKLVVYQYDAAGRLTLVRNKDAGIEYGEYDLLGRPHVTRSDRYSGGSGTGSSPSIAETHTQRHEWSPFDERTSWTMPASGSSVPPDDPSSPWLQTIVETRDAGSNIVEQNTPAGTVLSQSVGRSVGRINDRTLPVSGSAVTTHFGFNDGVAPVTSIELPPAGYMPAPSPNPSGLALFTETTAGGTRRAGSANARDKAARLHGVRDLSTDWLSIWHYDDRSRLKDGLLATFNPDPKTATMETLSDADFRSDRTPPPSGFNAAQHAALGLETSLALEPLRWNATELNGAHQIDHRDLYFEGSVQSTRNYTFDGGRRTGDGVWTFTFDDFGRLTTATNAAAGRQLAYEWDPAGRISGRTAYQKDSGGGWAIETRSSVLSADALPAETTFVWDPIVDRLVTIFAKGGGPVRQYLHGDQGYDDPIAVLASDTPGATPTRYLPLIDHAGTGSLMATLDDNGDVVERVIYADSYGDAPRYLHGPVVDKVTFQAIKDAAGNVQSVDVAVHVDERIVDASVPGSLSLAAVTGDGSTVYSISGDPTVDGDRHTLRWTLSGTDWSTVTSAAGAQSLQVTVKSGLHCEGWGNAAVQPVPSWALRLYSGTATTTQAPVIVRESFTSLAAYIAGTTTKPKELYSIPNLYLAASLDSKTKLFTGFKSAPFIEPATGLGYFRDRWYSPADGQWLTADGIGYGDSSNLYCGFAGDPVNNSDPNGQSATVIGGLVGTIAGSGYAIYREIRYGEQFFGANGTWRFIAQGAAAGAAIGFAIDTGGAGAGLSMQVLAGASFGAGFGGAISSVTSGGDWGAFSKGAAKGGVLGAIGGLTSGGIAAAGLSKAWQFTASVTADTYAGVGVDYAFGDCGDTASCFVTMRPVVSLATRSRTLDLRPSSGYVTRVSSEGLEMRRRAPG
jgi:RHS repeat-associated protein